MCPLFCPSSLLFSSLKNNSRSLDYGYTDTLIISPEHGVDVHEHSKVCEMLTLAPGPVLASLQGHTPRAVPRPEHGEQVLRGHVTVTMIQRKEIRSKKQREQRERELLKRAEKLELDKLTLAFLRPNDKV